MTHDMSKLLRRSLEGDVDKRRACRGMFVMCPGFERVNCRRDNTVNKKKRLEEGTVEGCNNNKHNRVCNHSVQ